MYNVYIDGIKEMSEHIEKGDLIVALAIMSSVCYFFKHINGVEELDEDIHHFVEVITSDEQRELNKQVLLDQANSLLKRFYGLGEVLVRAVPVVPKDRPDHKTLS